jgi:pimeloyl-ACP methyl ester carboxylesterase
LLVRSVRFNRSWFGVFTDMMYCVRDWSDLAQATVAAGVPVTHVHGTEDPTIMIEDARRFCDRFDGIDLVAVDGAGQLVLFDRPEVVFGEVARLAHRHR